MKKLVVVLAFGLGLASFVGCEEEDICNKAEDRCVACGGDPATCESTMDACRALPRVGPLDRDWCCEQELESINASCD